MRGGMWRRHIRSLVDLWPPGVSHSVRQECTCADNPDYIDLKYGDTCDEWVGRNCKSSDLSASQALELRRNCPVACKECLRLFGEQEKMDMFKVVAAVLHVGNICFDAAGSFGTPDCTTKILGMPVDFDEVSSA